MILCRNWRQIWIILRLLLIIKIMLIRACRRIKNLHLECLILKKLQVKEGKEFKMRRRKIFWRLFILHISLWRKCCLFISIIIFTLWRLFTWNWLMIMLMGFLMKRNCRRKIGLFIIFNCFIFYLWMSNRLLRRFNRIIFLLFFGNRFSFVCWFFWYFIFLWKFVLAFRIFICSLDRLNNLCILCIICLWLKYW